MKFLRWLLPVALALATCGRPASKRRHEVWSEWFAIPLGIQFPRAETSWRRPPEGLEFTCHLDPVPQFLMERWPCLGGRLLVRRGAVIEAWDLEARKLAWRLPAETGLIGWSLSESRVQSVLPDGPADLAGVKPGDQVVGINGQSTLFGFPLQIRCRAGDKIELALSSADGGRRVTVTAGRAPEPFGAIPEVASPIENDLLIERDGYLERLRLSDGRILWSIKGYFLAVGSNRVLMRDGETVSALSAPTGVSLWSLRDVPTLAEACAWSDQGPVVVSSRPERITIMRLDPSSGAVYWTFSSEGQIIPKVELVSPDECSW